MAITHGYCTRDELAAWMNISAIGDDEADRLDLAAESASRQIDERTGRQFYTETGTSDRLFWPNSAWVCDIADVIDSTSLVVKTDPDAAGSYLTTWTTDDYQLEPTTPVPGWPWTRLRAVGSKFFPYGWTWLRRPPVQVTAQWGWTTAPAPVKQACLILASNLYRRKDSPYAVLGFADAGVLRIRDDVDVTALLAPYAHNTCGVV